VAIIRDVAGGVGPDAAHRSLPRAVVRPCSRPSCTTPAAATLTFRYGTREAWIERLADRVDPQSYDLCVTHAARTHPPEGWQLRDRRPEGERRPAEPHPTPVDLGGDRTVAVLAAALRSVPDPVSEDAVAGPTEVDRAVATIGTAAGTMVQATAEAAPAPAEPPTAPRPPLVVRDRAASDAPRELAADW
jgi:PAS domain-containing protein